MWRWSEAPATSLAVRLHRHSMPINRGIQLIIDTFRNGEICQQWCQVQRHSNGPTSHLWLIAQYPHWTISKSGSTGEAYHGRWWWNAATSAGEGGVEELRCLQWWAETKMNLFKICNFSWLKTHQHFVEECRDNQAVQHWRWIGWRCARVERWSRPVGHAHSHKSDRRKEFQKDNSMINELVLPT